MTFITAPNPYYEKQWLTETVAINTHSYIAELGCREGDFTLAILAGMGDSGRLCCIDLYQENELSERIEEKQIEYVVNFLRNTQLYQDRIALMIAETEKAVAMLRDELFDIVFIDASHRYSAVKKDIDLWWPTLKLNGIMIGHDADSFVWNKTYIEMDYYDGNHHGVAKAIVEKFGIENITRGVARM